MVNKEGYAVDLVATFRSVLDDALFEEIENYFIRANYKYQEVLYGLGAHHGYWIHCESDDLSKKLYKESNGILKV